MLGANGHSTDSNGTTTVNGTKRTTNGCAEKVQFPATFFGERRLPVVPLPEFTPEEKQNRIRNANLVRLVESYRTYGHTKANINPLNHEVPNMLALNADPSLDLSNYGFENMDEEFDISGILFAKNRSKMTLREIIELLEKCYCGQISFEFMHIP
ncbi:hypothetical protein HK104_002676, partial [Borealophlyctis nickersoniae]